MNRHESLEKVRELIRTSSYTVFFGGAGISTDSGIPDFRGSQGLYIRPEEKLTEPPEYLLSHRCLCHEPEKFFDYYRTHMLYPDARPNAAHRALAEMEKRGLLQAVITQNIDGLHQAAGNRVVWELHGTTARAHCTVCGKSYDGTFIPSHTGIPHCPCGGTVRPDVVLYGEGLDEEVFARAAEAVNRAELLIVGGTSLTVYPAASLVTGFRGNHLVIINRGETSEDDRADVVFRESLSDILPLLL